MGALERNPGKADNWVEKAGGLPAYIEKIAESLHTKRGFTVSRAIATAVSMCKRWAAGGEDVNPDTRAKAAKAIAEWNAKRARARVDLSNVDDGLQLDLATLPDDEFIDLAYGDHRPPYDWKHGYKPISPQAMRIKAKREKAPDRPRGARGGSSPSPAASSSRSIRKTAAAKKAAAPKQRPKVAGATPEARDAVARGRATETERKAVAAEQRASIPNRTSSGSVGGMNPTETRVGAGTPTTQRERLARLAAGDASRTRPAAPAAPAKPTPKLTPAARRSLDALAANPAADLRVGPQRQLREAGYIDDNDKLTPAGRAAVSGARRNSLGSSERDLQDERARQAVSPEVRAAAERRRAERDAADAKLRERDATPRKPYPTKDDGSPDYGAMSAEQAATVRAQQAGRGVGARVDTDQGPATVKAVSTRGTTLEFDDPDVPNRQIPAGTPGHSRIRPATPNGDWARSWTDEQKEEWGKLYGGGRERYVALRKEGKNHADAIREARETGGERPPDRAPVAPGGGPATTGDPRSPERQAADRQAYDAARGPVSTSGIRAADLTPDQARAELARLSKLAPETPAGKRTKNNRVKAVQKALDAQGARQTRDTGRSAGSSESGQATTPAGTGRFTPREQGGTGSTEPPNERRKTFTQAKEAEQRGDYATAERLYRELGNRPDDVAKMRTAQIRAGQTPAAAPSAPAVQVGDRERAIIARETAPKLAEGLKKLRAAGRGDTPLAKAFEAELNKRRRAEGNR